MKDEEKTGRGGGGGGGGGCSQSVWEGERCKTAVNVRRQMEKKERREDVRFVMRPTRKKKIK